MDYTEKETFYKKTQENLKKTHASLEKGHTLQAASPHLKELGILLQDGTKALDTYEALIQQTFDLNKQIAANREALNASAEKYMDNCKAYLSGQNEKLTEEINSGNEENSKAILERLSKVTMINNVIDYGHEARIGAFKSQALRNPEIMKDAMGYFPKINNEIAALKKMTSRSEDHKRIDEIKMAGTSYNQSMIDFLENWLTLEKLAEQRTIAGNSVTDTCDVVAHTGMESTQTIAKETMSALSLASTIMIIGLIIALVLGILVAFVITRSITKPINCIIAGLNEGSDQVASASGQVSSASQSLAEGSSEQAASIEETSSSMEEMSSMTKSNAENAGIANSLMKEAGHVVNTANTSMHDLIQSMEEISKASEDTSKIIKTIDEIAFQTNLLALNAAVEAARAGEAGAGFAVVADEVRNLAMKAAQAAKNTSELIEGTIKKVNDGSVLVSTTNEAFLKMANSTTKVANLVSEISQASREQSNGISQVNIAITEMDKVVQQNAANAEESASASEEMSAQAEQLKKYVEDLVIIVTGNRNQSYALNQPVARPRQMKPTSNNPRTIQQQKGKMLSHGSNEVKPNEVIPFDEDENFTNF